MHNLLQQMERISERIKFQAYRFTRTLRKMSVELLETAAHENMLKRISKN